jgi:hypothetical protein
MTQAVKHLPGKNEALNFKPQYCLSPLSSLLSFLLSVLSPLSSLSLSLKLSSLSFVCKYLSIHNLSIINVEGQKLLGLT